MARPPDPGERREDKARRKLSAAGWGHLPRRPPRSRWRCARSTPRLDLRQFARARSPSRRAVRKKLRDGGREFARSVWMRVERVRDVKLFRDGREVFHVRADDDRLAEIGRLQDVVAAALRQRSAHEDRLRPAQRAPPVRRWNRAAELREGTAAAREVRRVNATPARVSFSATMSNRSGLRGARISSSPGCAAERFRERPDHRIVFIHVARRRREAWCWRRSILGQPGLVAEIRDSGAMPAAGGVKSYFRFPPTFTRSGGAPAMT